MGILLSGCTFAKLPDIQTLAIQLANELMKNGKCFHCCQKGHLSRNCHERTGQFSRSVQLSDLEALIKR
ncbi:hypothetical protein VP01_14446g1, partial [Puccinia sorghi]